MKAVFVGGGAHRHLATLRRAMAEPGIFERDDQIVLYDLDMSRAETIGRLLLKSPEQARRGCSICWDQSLDRALEGADVVSLVLMGGSRESFALGHAPSLAHGYISSDNLSPSGALLAVKTAPIVLDLARRMRKHCPDALLLCFANPVAVLSALVNNHAGVRALGVCAGYTNHLWDLPRLLGEDRWRDDIDVDVAGVNHLSFILRGRIGARPLIPLLRRHLAQPDWRPPALASRWGSVAKQYMRQGLRDLRRHLLQLDALVFSTEGDGMAHLDYEAAVARARRHPAVPAAQVRRHVRGAALHRRQQDATLRSALGRDIDWQRQAAVDPIFRVDEDIFVKILRAVAGVREEKIVASRPGDGAVVGIEPRGVVEYSQRLFRRRLEPAGTYTLPPAVRGMVAAMSAHQTLLADALAANDPRLLAQALMVYPIRPYSRDLRQLSKKLLRINHDEIPAALRRAGDYL